MPLLEKKRFALMEYNKNPSERNKIVLQAAKSVLQRESRRCANQYREDLCTEIQRANDMGNIKAMYEKIRIALGPVPNKVAPLKSSSGEQLT